MIMQIAIGTMHLMHELIRAALASGSPVWHIRHLSGRTWEATRQVPCWNYWECP